MASSVVITGSPIGIGISQFWKAALRGQSGITAIESFGDLPMEGGYCLQIAWQIPSFQPPGPDEDKFSSRGDRYAQMALTATRDAIHDSGLC